MAGVSHLERHSHSVCNPADVLFNLSIKLSNCKFMDLICIHFDFSTTLQNLIDLLIKYLEPVYVKLNEGIYK